MNIHQGFFALVGLLLVLWAHLSDPPTRSVDAEEPQLSTGTISFPLLLFLLLRFFVMAFVLFLAVFLGVFLLVYCKAYSRLRQLLYKLYGRTWIYKSQRVLLGILLLTNAVKFPIIIVAYKDQPPLQMSTPECRDFFAVKHLVRNVCLPEFIGRWQIERIRRYDIRNAAHALVRRMLLVIAGVET